MKNAMWKRSGADRRGFIGGSDARIIMGTDEQALIRLWREKRGEVEPQDLSSNLVVPRTSIAAGMRPIPGRWSPISSRRFVIPCCAGWGPLWMA